MQHSILQSRTFELFNQKRIDKCIFYEFSQNKNLKKVLTKTLNFSNKTIKSIEFLIFFVLYIYQNYDW